NQKRQDESQLSATQKPLPIRYWRLNMEVTQKLLPLTIGTFSIASSEKLISVLNIGTNNHNIYDNLAAQVLTAKLNIKNQIQSCEKLDDAIRYGDQKLRAVNYLR